MAKVAVPPENENFRLYHIKINNLTVEVFKLTPSGKFLCMYSKSVSAVEPVSFSNCIKEKYVLNSY